MQLATLWEKSHVPLNAIKLNELLANFNMKFNWLTFTMQSKVNKNSKKSNAIFNLIKL